MEESESIEAHRYWVKHILEDDEYNGDEHEIAHFRDGYNFAKMKQQTKITGLEQKLKIAELWKGKYYDKVDELNLAEQKLEIAMECVELYCDDNAECDGDYHPPNFARKCRDKIEQITERRMK